MHIFSLQFDRVLEKDVQMKVDMTQLWVYQTQKSPVSPPPQASWLLSPCLPCLELCVFLPHLNQPSGIYLCIHLLGLNILFLTPIPISIPFPRDVLQVWLAWSPSWYLFSTRQTHSVFPKADIYQKLCTSKKLDYLFRVTALELRSRLAFRDSLEREVRMLRAVGSVGPTVPHSCPPCELLCSQ